jgi:hypothetical protein
MDMGPVERVTLLQLDIHGVLIDLALKVEVARWIRHTLCQIAH